MDATALVKDLKDIDLPLEHIYLDPNNPRFVGRDWIRIPDTEIENESVQEDTRRKLVQSFAVDNLKINMEVNGYLPIDRVIVRKLHESAYVVLEGNRRICAAKMISQLASDGSTVPDDVLESMKSIPCLQYTGTAYLGSEMDASWIFQGLRHISGIMGWSAFNKAKLLVEQRESEGITLTEVGKRFGLTAYGAGQWMRGYYAFKQASEESDYINEIDERSYTYFQELFSRSSTAVRDWIDWDGEKLRFKNDLNFNEFISWLYPRPDDEEEAGVQSRGDWERRALKRADDIRQVAYLIQEDKELFDRFVRAPDLEKDLEKTYAEALSKKHEREAKESYDPELEVFRTIRECTKAINDIPHRLLKDSGTRDRLFEEFEKLEKAISDARE